MSRTQTVTTERPHDHLYDTNYIVPSQRDHERALQRAAAATVEPVARYDNMFSDVQNYQRVSYRTKVDRRKLAPVHVKPMTHAEVVQKTVPASDPDVAGRDRHAFFRRPVVPTGEDGYHEIPDTMIRVAPVEPVDTAPVPRLPTPPIRTVGTMTDFRDSETQTDPFSPDYYVPENVATEPEVLLLGDFRYGQTPGQRLPAGEADVEQIEKLREKRAFQQQLPEIVPGETDQKTFALRRAMLEEIERQEFEEHEAAIDEELDARLQHIQQKLMDRDSENQQRKQERVEQIWRQRYETKEKSLVRIQQRRIKTMRKLARQHGDAEGKREKRDVIAEYTDFGSTLYAPRLRDGFKQRRTGGGGAAGIIVPPHEQAALVSEGLDLRSMDVLEQSIPASALETRVELPRKTLTRQEQQMEGHLQRMEGTLKKYKDAGTGTADIGLNTSAAAQALAQAQTQSQVDRLSVLQRRKPKEAPRPPTPDRSFDGIDNELADAIVLLQRLLAGRAVQELMFAGKERRRELIEELRVQEEMDVEEPMRAPQEAEEKAALIHEQHIDSALAAIQAGVIGDMLDHGAKELERAGEEARLLKMADDLERARRLREAIETGRRQKELIRRSKRDERFRQLARLQQFTEDSLVGAAVARAVDAVATEQAQAEVVAEAEAEKLNPRPAMAPEREVRALLEGFVVPETRRRTDHMVDTSERRFVVAGHRTMQHLVDQAGVDE